MMILLYGFAFSAVVGTLGHFLFKISNQNKIIGFFFARSESVWSHIKLGLTPMFIWTFLEKIVYHDIPNYWALKGYAATIFAGTIIIFYYLEKWLLKKDYAIYNIILFYIALFNAYILNFILLNIIDLPNIYYIIGYLFLAFFIFLYFYETFKKPKYFIFRKIKKE